MSNTTTGSGSTQDILNSIEDQAVRSKITSRLMQIQKELPELGKPENITGDRGDLSEIICPLTFRATGGRAAVNYDISPSKLKVGGREIEAWRSAPQKRGHTDQFQHLLRKMQDEGKLPQDWNAYYFWREQGVQARLSYEQMVLLGKAKANKRSWGPTGDQGGQDKSRFHKFTGVTYDELVAAYPQVYGTKAEKATASEPEADISVEQAGALDVTSMTDDEVIAEIEGHAPETAAAPAPSPTEETVTDEDIEPTDTDIEEIEMHEEETEAVAASTDVLDPSIGEIAALDELRPAEETMHETPTTVHSEPEVHERTSEGDVVEVEWNGRSDMMQQTAVTFKGSDQEFHTCHLVWVPSLDREMLLEEGSYVIDGEDVTVKVTRKES